MNYSHFAGEAGGNSLQNAVHAQIGAAGIISAYQLCADSQEHQAGISDS